MLGILRHRGYLHAMQIAASLIREILYGAVQAGVPLPALAQAAGLGLAELHANDRPYDLATVNAVWQAALRLSGDPLLGLHTGAQVHFEAIGVVGFTMQNSPDLRTALERGAHYGSIYSRLLEVQFTLADNRGVVTFVPLPVFGQAYPVAARQGVESSMAFVVRALDKLAGRPVAPVAVRSAFPPPPADQRPEYARLFGPDLRFEAPESTITYALADLRAPVVSYNAALFKLLDQEAGRLLQAQAHAAPFQQRVLQALAGLVKSHYPSLEVVASQLSVSPRTLQRKLRDEGTSYQEVLERLQRDIATHYLRGTSLAVAEIAYLLGYSEPGVFTRAFKRWTGNSPTAYREQVAL